MQLISTEYIWSEFKNSNGYDNLIVRMSRNSKTVCKNCMFEKDVVLIHPNPLSIYYPYLLSSCEAPSAVLCPDLGPPVQVGHGALGVGPEEGH